MDDIVWTATFNCAAGHVQQMHYGRGFTLDMVEDHCTLMFGGRLHSLGTMMPGYGCAWDEGAGRCGAKVSWTVKAAEVSS